MHRTNTLSRLGGSVHVRVYYPHGRSAATLVYLHGGWTLLDIDTHDRLMWKLTAAAGVAVIGVDCPRDSHPDCLKADARWK